MKAGQRPSLAVNAFAITGGPLPSGVRAIALKRAREILARGAQYASLPDLLAAAYLLGVEDAADAVRSVRVLP